MSLPAPIPRGPSARSYLQMAWEYPVYKVEAKKSSGDTVAKTARVALSREAALAYLAGDDPRPLLVLRECKVCNGTDEALLKGGVDNEKTFMLAAWFHCVKLPADVMEEDHPFHNVFVEKQPEHLFVCSVDGSNHDSLESQTSRTELWKSMRGVIAKEYKSKPDSSLKSIAKLLDKMDVADTRLSEVKARREDVLEQDGPKSRKLVKLNRDVQQVEAACTTLKEGMVKALRMELRKKKTVDKG